MENELRGIELENAIRSVFEFAKQKGISAGDLSAFMLADELQKEYEVVADDNYSLIEHFDEHENYIADCGVEDAIGQLDEARIIAVRLGWLPDEPRGCPTGPGE